MLDQGIEVDSLIEIRKGIFQQRREKGVGGHGIVIEKEQSFNLEGCEKGSVDRMDSIRIDDQSSMRKVVFRLGVGVVGFKVIIQVLGSGL